MHFPGILNTDTIKKIIYFTRNFPETKHMSKKLKQLISQFLLIIRTLSILESFQLYRSAISIKKLITKRLENGEIFLQFDDAINEEKYLIDMNYWVVENLFRFYELGLQDNSNVIDILDISTGMGYFPFIANVYGKSATSTDTKNELYDKVTQALNVKKVDLRINGLQAISPSLNGQKFDYITSFMICFNGHKSPNLWGIQEWDYFLRDLSENLLTPDGTLALYFNLEADGNPFSSELNDYFLRLKGVISGNKLILSKPLFKALV